MSESQNNEELPMSPGEAMIAMSRQFTGEQRHNGIRFLQAMEERDPFSCTAISMPGMAFWNSSAKTPEQKAHIIDRANTLQKGINLELW
jgi:hypothetical protein